MTEEIETKAVAATDLFGVGLRVVPTARRSHTTVPGRAPMRPPRVSCQEVDPFAGGRSCCAWQPRGLERFCECLDKRGRFLQFGWALALFI